MCQYQFSAYEELSRMFTFVTALPGASMLGNEGYRQQLTKRISLLSKIADAYTYSATTCGCDFAQRMSVCTERSLLWF